MSVSPLTSSSPVMHEFQPALPHTGLADTPATTMPPSRTVNTETSSPQCPVQEMSPATPSLSRTTTFAQPLRHDTLQGISPTTSALSRATTFVHPLRQYTSMRDATASTKAKKALHNTASEETIQVEADGDYLQKPRVSRERTWLRNWWQEIASSIISMICLGAIIIVLKRFENLSATKWALPITINSMVAIFTSIMKACLVFPVAECPYSPLGFFFFFFTRPLEVIELTFTYIAIGQIKWLRFSSDVRSLNELVHFDLATRGPWGCLTLLVGQLFRPTRS